MATRVRAGIGLTLTPLNNGFAAVDDVAAVQTICDRLDEHFIIAGLAKRTAALHCPSTAEHGCLRA